MADQTKREVDLRGMTCPAPVIKTKKLFDDQNVTTVEAMVDDDVCVNNLQRLAKTLKANFSVQDRGGHFAVTLDRSGSAIQQTEGGHTDPTPAKSLHNSAPAQTGTILFIASDTLGKGEEEFSRTLLNLFLQTIFDSGLQPRAILLINSGVTLLARESQTLKVLNDLKNAGCEVLACGLCVDFYQLKEQIPREQITNMFAIAEYLFAAEKVIQP